MELNRKLSSQYFSSSDSYRLERLIEEKHDNSEELITLKGLICKLVTELVLDSFPDKKSLELSKQFPSLYYTTKTFDLDLRTLGIIREDSHGYTEDDVLSLSPTLRSSLEREFPTTSGKIIKIDAALLSKLSEEKLEALKGWVSQLIHLLWKKERELRDLRNDRYDIKTFGKLYRTNQDWYELIVRDRYSDYIVYDEEELKKQKEQAIEIFIKSLEDLKPILGL